MPRAAAVREVMSAPVAVVREHDTAWRALVRLTETGLRHLVVLDDTDALVGVLDDRLVLSRWPLDGLGTHRQTVGELVRPTRSGPGGPLRVHADDPVVAAAALMLRCRVDALPVVDDAGAVIGIVTGSDLVRAMVQAAVQHGERPVTG